MTLIDPILSFQGLASAEDKYQMANSLALDYLGFAVSSHYYDRIYGVMSGALESDFCGNFVVNTCIREALWRGLYDVQSEIERRVGYNLSERYHQEILAYPFKMRHKLSWPGLAAIHVQPVWIDHELAVEVSPFIIADAPVATGAGNPIVTLDKTVVSNPHDVILRKGVTYGTYKILNQGGYPKRDVSGDWEVMIDGKVPVYDALEPMAVQHRKFAYIDVDIPDDLEGELLPVYPGTTQVIPQAQPYQMLDLNTRRYWFYIWTLIDPAFYNTEVDLVSGQLYKLLQTVEFKERQEMTIYGRLEQRKPDNDACDCDGDHNYQVSMRVVDASRGIVDFSIDGELIIDPDTDLEVLSESNCPQVIEYDGCSIYTLTVYYKTHPSKLPAKFSAAIPNLIRAALHRVASELPLKDCKCEIQDGFIFDQQRSYGTVIRTPGGDTLMSNKYGERHGQRVYLEIMHNAPTYHVTRL